MRNLASERVRIGLSQRELGDILGVSRETVSRYESGAVKLTTETTVKLANLFNCSTDYLLGVTDERLPR